ncbi:MAG TPA: P-loop NTPase [Clostridia bacterium]|nr:P-loop NTPase [Clostridia bacterium]
MLSPTKLITVISGHYGSGKTEFSVNLAFSLANEGKRVSLIDLDIVNPYFCSREREAQLAQSRIELIAQSAACRSADVPALPPEISRMFFDETGFYIVDVGGDDVGARVLSRYLPQFEKSDYDLWLVVNANRPQTGTPAQALTHLQRIEQASRLKVSGIVNNTHLCGQTTLDEVRRGSILAAQLCQTTGLPLICNVVPRTVLRKDDNPAGIEGVLFPIDIWMKKPWES